MVLNCLRLMISKDWGWMRVVTKTTALELKKIERVSKWRNEGLGARVRETGLHSPYTMHESNLGKEGMRMEQVSESGEVGGSRVGSSIPDQYTRLSWRRCSCLHSRVTNPPLPVFPFPSIARHFGLPPLKPLSTPTPFNPGPSQPRPLSDPDPLNLWPSQPSGLFQTQPLLWPAPARLSPSQPQLLSIPFPLNFRPSFLRPSSLSFPFITNSAFPSTAAPCTWQSGSPLIRPQLTNLTFACYEFSLSALIIC